MRYVLAIAELGSLTRAAERLELAQPALTQALNRLEREMGVKLFDRTRRGASLTDAGHALIDDLRASVAHGDAAIDRARSIAEGRAGRLVVGFVTHAVYNVLPTAISRLKAAHPQIDFKLREMSNAEQVVALERGEIDVALLHPPVSVDIAVHEKRLGHDRLIAAIPASEHVPGDGMVSLADVAAHGLVWFPAGQMSVLRAEILSAVRRRGHNAFVVQEANRTLTVLACVAGGLGWSLLPESACALKHEGVRYAVVRDGGELPSFDLHAIWPARSRRTLADMFADMLPTANEPPSWPVAPPAINPSPT
jgi:DNA-binding transcriptional LysR family regulator